jgi:cytochrome c-type biogenesis protein CcmH/NrfF
MFNIFKKKTDEEKSLEKCGCSCRCPKCNNVLNLESKWTPFNVDGAEGKYTCSKCGHNSIWEFSAPVPILIS